MTEKVSHISPPKWANRFLEWYCAYELIDEIQGDLLEAFHYRSAEEGVLKAKWWFVWDVMRFFRPSSFGKRSYNSNQIAMFKNYLLVGLRSFRKQKGYSFINLSGLIVGITACLLISLHVLEEVTYDNFHPNADRTYRVVMDMYSQGELKTKSAPVFAAVGPNLLTDLPEVEMVTRILPFGTGVYSVRNDDGTLIRFNETKAVFADANFFRMFGFKLLDGNADEVLSEPNQTVLSESAAQRYFGSENPLGKTIIYRGTQEVKVTGVYEDFPENSHLQFDLISSLKNLDNFENLVNNWGWYDFYTFVKTPANVSQDILDEKLATYLDEKKAESFTERNVRQEMWSQRVGDIHLYSTGLSWDMGQNGGGDRIYFLTVIAALVLIIAWVNYVNLSTARAIKRAKEVGVRKVVGAQKGNLMMQFMVESFLYNAFAVLISLLLVWLSIPFINTAMDITLELSILFGPVVLGGLFSLMFLGTLFSGLYPALVLTSFKPVTVLKGRMTSGNRKFGFRQVLVIFQFTASITLILGTFLVVKQLSFMRNQDLGMNIDQTLVVQAPSSGSSYEDLVQRLDVFRTEIEAMSAVRSFTATSGIPSVENFWTSAFNTKHFPQESRSGYRMAVDDQFFEQFEVDMLAGRGFSKEMATDTSAMILNAVALKHLGFSSPEEAIGEKINPNSERPWTIIGVVDNYHQASLKTSLDPVLFSFNRNESGNYYALKINGKDYADLIATVERTWDNIYPDNPFEYFFLDEQFDKQYKSDEQFNAVFIGFAVLAIFVASLGLFGLISFTAEQSKKEISIRKVLGATSYKLVILLAKGYVRLILAAIVIAAPLGYYLMTQWLDGFAYRTVISPDIFIFGIVGISLIALATVSFKSFGAANSNPVNSLRDE